MKRETLTGKIQGNERGYAFLLPEIENGRDYFISHGDLRGAMHGDTVIADTVVDGEKTTARVVKVINRGIKEVVGTYFSNKFGGYVVPDDNKYFCNIHILQGKGSHAKSGDKVVAKIISYPKQKSPEGIITKVLGRQFEKKAELKSILYNFDIIDKFSLAVIEEANSFSNKISKQELNNRRDFTKLNTFTIDGEDARDFDDAVSIEKLENGYLLGVHIADVSHYVKESSVIDEEAFNRGCSIYFPEKVIPMLPENLCNNLCSLVEGEIRLTLSCMMKIDFSGNVYDYEITPSYIISKKRTTYSKVLSIIDGDEKVIDELKQISNDVLLMNELREILFNKRKEKGSINLEVKESRILVDERGNIQISQLTNDKARNLIEEFMIIANVTVAEYFYYTELPFIYRIHDKPTIERVDNFYNFLAGLGINTKRKKDEIFSKDFSSILDRYKDTRFFTLINRVMLRTMQKAKYSPECIGHFGLSEEKYCHFTSPIRRYPDLVIHRILKEFIANGSSKIEEKYSDFVYQASEQSSTREKISMEAERAVDDYYKLLYISNHENEIFEGTVSGVAGFGFFVELDNGVEGLVKLETLKGKRYSYDKDKFLLTNGKNTYRLGDRVTIKVSGVNLIDKKACFTLEY